MKLLKDVGPKKLIHNGVLNASTQNGYLVKRNYSIVFSAERIGGPIKSGSLLMGPRKATSRDYTSEVEVGK